MKNLLLDIGNSEIKVGTGSQADGSIVNLISKFRYDKSKFEADFKNQFPADFKKSAFLKAGISALNTGNNDFLTNFFYSELGITPLFISGKIELPVRIDYSEGLGNDRICNAVAASLEHTDKNFLVVDFGTATTYTLIENKTIAGGLISPGILTSLKSLLQNTDLPDAELTFPDKLITKNSVDNIRAGIMFSSLYSAERIIIELSAKYDYLFVIFTGGFSEIMFDRTMLADHLDKLLVLKGINHILNYESSHKRNN